MSTMTRRVLSDIQTQRSGWKNEGLHVDCEVSGCGMDETLSDASDIASQMNSNSGINS